MMRPINIAVVYHSLYGHTARQADAVREGVDQLCGAESLLLTVEEAQTRWDDLTAAHAIIFGAPTYMGSASAGFKAFQDATSTAVLAKGFAWKDKIAAGFTNSGARSGDKLATLIQIALFAAQHGMHCQPRSAARKQFHDGVGRRSQSSRLLVGRRGAVECRSRP
jgi:multimeric flavodoxin WrbA